MIEADRPQHDVCPAEAPAALPCNIFTTETLPHGQRLEAWNARFRTLNAVSVADPAASVLACRNENWLLGALLFSANRTSAARFERTARHVRASSIDHWVIRVLRQGENRVTHRDRTDVLAPGQPFLFSLDRDWTSDWSNAEWLSLCLPRDAFPDISAGLAALGTGPLRGPGAPLLADYLVMLEQHLRRATAEQMPMLAEATRAMVAACLLRDVAPRSLGTADVGVAQFERVRALVRRHLASPTLNAQRLARLAGMSRSSLYRLMEPHGGVAHYIQTLRLKLAHALLSDPALAAVPIAALAERAGFFDASTFSRAFRAAFGYTPREARSAGLAGRSMAAAPGASEALLREDFDALLRRIASRAALPLSDPAAPAPAP
jgi:AraC-like DNA-binding protein